jgi:high-affinity nickel-transport protein
MPAVHNTNPLIKLRPFWSSLSARERRTLAAMVAAVAGLHVLGFAALLASVAPGFLPIGIGVTAYTLGLRHAFDADHISAIDNTTRKLMAEGKRPLSVGFWFSLGHSTIVFGLALLISIGVRTLDGPVSHDHSTLHGTAGYVGTAVSGGFLYLIAAINIVILLGIVKVFREMRTGRYDDSRTSTSMPSGSWSSECSPRRGQSHSSFGGCANRGTLVGARGLRAGALVFREKEEAAVRRR